MRRNYICPKSIGAKNNCESGRREICSQHSAERGGNIRQKLKSSMTVSEARWRRGNWRPGGDLGFIHTSAWHPSKIKNTGSIPKSRRRQRFEPSPNSPLSHSKSPNKQSAFFLRTQVMRKEQVTRIYITDCREMTIYRHHRSYTHLPGVHRRRPSLRSCVLLYEILDYV